MRKLIPVAISSLVGSTGMAADLNVKVEIPRLNVAEYHRPYVAIWIERADQSFVGNLAVWSEIKKKNNEGNRYLKDLRQWWRRSGRELQMPIDGLSGATRVVGEHALSFAGDKGALAHLAEGDYQLLVEAAREGGGREVVKVPFHWGGKTEQNGKVQGEHELGSISVNVKP